MHNLLETAHVMICTGYVRLLWLHSLIQSSI